MSNAYTFDYKFIKGDPFRFLAYYIQDKLSLHLKFLINYSRRMFSEIDISHAYLDQNNTDMRQKGATLFSILFSKAKHAILNGKTFAERCSVGI